MPSTPTSSILCIGRCCRKYEEAEEDTLMEPKRRQNNNENPDPGYALAEPTLLGEQSNISSSATAKLSIASASRRRMCHNNRHCRRFFMSREILAVSACVFFSFLLFPFAAFANANTEEPPPSPFASMSNDFTRLKELSSNMNGLRGSSDAAAGLVPIFEEFKDILQNHIASMQSMEHMLEEGDIDGVAHVVHTLLSDTKLLSLVTQDTKDIEGGVGGIIKDMEDDGLSLDNIPDLVREGGVPSASIVEFMRKEDFQDLTENLINIARNLDSVDLSFLAASNGRRLNEDLHRQREREPLTYDTESEEHSEEHKNYDFGGEYLNFFGPNHHFKPSHQQFTKVSSTMGGKLKSVMKAARRKRHMPRLHKFFNDNDNDGRERRLRAETRVQRRRLALQNSGGSNQWCQEECPIDNTTCNCEQLFNCIKRMSVYDAAVLFSDGYIVTDMNNDNFANFTTDVLNLYDVANGALYEKFLAIQQYAYGPANEEQCTNLLMEMHKPCDSTSSATCSDVNSQSYQLTVDQVCDGVNTDTKLYFEAIFDAYSIKPGAQLSLSYSPSASYDSCAQFVREFDRLYDFRNETLFPHFNPMRVDSTQPLTSTENTILFEDTYFFTSYTFVQNQHGVETVNSIRPISTDYYLTPVTGGCPQIKDETTCLSSKDGRDNWLNQPCRWCCGYKCTPAPEGGNLCEPETWLLEQPSYIGLSINGLGNGFCSRPASIYDGSSTSFDGRCIDAFGNNYCYVTNHLNVEFSDVSSCPDFCQSLPNSELQVGYLFISGSCECYYEKDTLPEYSDLDELGISAFIYTFSPGIGPVSKGDGASDFKCHLTPSDQEKSARGAMQLCDATMSLFLGNSVSVGRLRQIVNELEENGSSYMPGECCLDTAATSARFGFNFDPSKMDCNNRGLWHLGISEEACENANGKWFRSPCYALKDCIDDRPKKCPTAHSHSQDDSGANDDCDDDAFSKSFEQFAKDIEIDDATDEEECSYARQQLGFDNDYMYDAEVCAEFRERMCDPFYDDVDEVTDQTIEYEAIGYTPPSYPPDPAFDYDELPAKPSATTVTDDDEHTEALNALQYSQQVAWGWYQTTTLREYHSNVEKDGLCQTESSFWRILCYIGYVLFLVFWETVRGAALTGWQVISLAYIAMQQQKVNYSKFNFEILQNDGNWAYDALNIMNKNMVDINTQLQNHLQDRHQSMEVNINTYNMCSTNYLGINLMKAIEPDAIVSDLPLECQAILFPSDRRYLVEEFKLEVVWPESDKEGKGLVSKMFPNLKRTVSDIKEEIIERVIEGINDGKKSKCDKESPEERNLLSDSLDLNEEASYDDILGALDVKVEGMQEMNRRIESKMETTLEAVDEKLNKMETKLEEKIETKFKTLEEKMETLEKKIERKFEVTDRKMDEMKNMIAQLLEQMAKQSVTETEEQ